MRMQCRLLAAVMACLLTSASLATAQSYPTALSDSAKAMFAAYDARIIAAIRQSKSDDIPVRDMPTAFPRKYGVPIIRDIFGSDWAPIRQYADAALADLPLVDPADQFAADPTIYLDVNAFERMLRASPEKARETEEIMATYRLWDPMKVANTVSAVVMGRKSPEEVARNSITNGYVSRHLARTSWQGRDALILYEGAWVVVFNYMRTTRGLIWATEIGLYPR